MNWPHPTARAGLALLLVLAATVSVALGQRRGGGRGGVWIEPNAPYNGQFAFVRLRYQEYGASGWAFDYPQMERNFMTIVQDLTTIGPHLRESNVFLMDDPELFNHPIAYLSEPGYWLPTESEAAGLRDWLLKGGFLIVDDFYFNQWNRFEESMRMVLPEGRILPLTVDHQIFDTFFQIQSLEGMHHPSTQQARAQYLGIHENNDPSQRLMVIINYNNDIGDYMEWSGEGWYPVNMSNDAYNCATNYLIYGLSR